MIGNRERIRFGGDYNPEQFEERVWAEDVRLMREAGVDLVNVGVFSWSRIQPREGAYEFGWLDRVLDLLHANGIAVGLATATASPPPWAHARYPGLLPRDIDGHTLGPGSRQHYSASSLDYRRLAGELVHAIADRYRDHPAVALWHVNNEYGCHVAVDYSDAAAERFRSWLASRYGSLETLNHAWGGAFWSQLYSDWADVLPPRRAPHSRNPAQVLDFRRFSSDMLLECFVMEKRILRERGASQPVTTNFIGPWATIDPWRWVSELDIVSDDSYPDPDDPEGFRENALHCDLSRSLAGGRPWLRMEASPHPGAWRSSPVPREPGRVRALSWQAVGRGADGIQFFQWRQSPAGAEKFHAGMVPHTGTQSRSWREIAELGTELATVAPQSADAKAEVALILDFENWWALDDPDLPAAIDYAEAVRRWYRALHAEHVAIDVVPAGADLSSYRLIVAPQLYLLHADAARGLEAAASRGATVVVGAFSDVVDESVRFIEGGFLMRLGPMLGLRVDEQCGLAPRDGAGSTVEFDLDGVRLVGESIVDVVQPTDAEVVARFLAGRFKGEPAITRRAIGRGAAWYVATVPDAAATGVVVRRLLAESAVAPLLSGLPPLVDVARRGDLLTVINHGPACTVDTGGWPADDGAAPGAVTLAPFEVLRVSAGRR